MLNFLDPLGLPLKYAVFGCVGAPAGVLIANALGLTQFDPIILFSTAVGGAFGGLIGGYIRHRRGKPN